MTDVKSPMSNYYAGKSIFLTGGSGFLGQLYVQKLLTLKLKTLYLFMRPKRSENPAQRLEKLFQNAVFDKLKLEVPHYLEKIKIITGSLDQPGLGIHEDDLKELNDNVELVIHAAADVRFNRTLIELVNVNLKGTRELLKICTLMPKLRLFTYISTCYSNCVIETIEERIYDAPVDPNSLIELAKVYSQDERRREIFDILTNKYIQPWQNTYTFTKALSESVVQSFENDFPICVVRPSIVLSTYKDPEPGWVNNYFGFIGVMYSIALGIIRVHYTDLDTKIDLICADCVINSTLAVIWSKDDDQFKIKGEFRPSVYSVASGRSNPVCFGNLQSLSVYSSHIPLSQSIWFPSYVVTTNEVLYYLLSILLEIIPAIMFDIYFKISGVTHRLLPVYRMIKFNMGHFKYFIKHQWTFIDDNTIAVYDKMTEFDKMRFPSDMRAVDWLNYFYDAGHGVRKHILKDKTDWTTAFRRVERLRNIHLITKYLFFGIFVFVVYSIGIKMLS